MHNSIGMNGAIVQSQTGVTLVGGGPVSARDLSRCMGVAPRLVAADGGADRLLKRGHAPEAVIGDMDSISDAARLALAGRLHPVPEQETTDFDKALRHIAAPFVLGLGFSGGRLDHGLAALNTLIRHPDRRCLILGQGDVCFLSPVALTLTLPVGSRLSLFPMAPVTGTSQGLRWPINDLDFAPGGRVGTSNEVSAPQVRLTFDVAAMLVILPGSALSAALTGLLPSPAHGG